MTPAVLEKPRFNVDQLTSATEAAKRFSEVRKRAKKEPQFITDRNAVDSVIMSYEEFEAMYCELAGYRERELLAVAAARIAEGDVDAGRERVSLEDAMGEDGYAAYLACDADSVSDEDLFE
ncbi:MULTISPECIES: type II toxin-antitoxin system Phd/YefM family antitoxin [unclassified Adlercreutzia]|uniref:type II toxin-antitoxin system Phd/YefM family antitoxin n=1 Tax=unclassified Adlercreutzia TaxID=2636013 RepID=UPI0013EB1F20|nr:MULTISPECIES: type II toxin-antitoxin system Phd/YefM family antitoxin [unclassified Adlercreutzia]